MSIITTVVPNTKQIQNSGEGFQFNFTPESPFRNRPFSPKENQLFTELMTKHNAFICGGFAAHCIAMENGINLEYGDIDFYFPTEQDFENAKNYVKFITGFSDHQLENKPYMGESIRACTFNLESRTYQLIRATFGTVEEIFNTFDFSNSKAAIRYNPSEISSLEYMFVDKLPVLQGKGLVEYRIQQHLKFDTLAEKQKHARGNVERLEKYLKRYPNGFVDEESKMQLLQQYAWDFKYNPTEPYSVTELCKILIGATQDQLILFFPLGGEWKKAFETNGAHLHKWVNKYDVEKHVMFPDANIALGDPDTTMWSMLKGKLGI